MNAFSRYPSGNPLFIERYEATAINNYKIWQVGGGGGTYTLYNAANTNQNVFSKACAAFLSSGVNNGWIGASKAMALPANKRIGLEISWASPNNIYELAARMGQMKMQVTYLDGSGDYFSVGVLYRPRAPDGGALIVMDTGSDFDGTPFAFLTGREVANVGCTWQNAKMIVDLANKKYVKLLWNEYEYDLSMYNIQRSATDQGPNRYMDPSIWLYDVNPAIQYTIYISNFIVTNEE